MVFPKKYLSLSPIDREEIGEKNIIFLGLWCLDKAELIEYKDSNLKIINYISESEDEKKDAYEVVNKAYKKILVTLSSNLNSIHKTSRSLIFWEILVGYWLRQYLEVLYDRYRQLSYAHSLTPLATIKESNPEDYITPNDSDDFSTLVFTDFYNHQLISQINNYKKIFPAEILKVKRDISLKDTLGRKKRNKFLIRLVTYASSYLGKFNRVVFVKTYFSWTLLFRLGVALRSIPLLGVPALKEKTIPINKITRDLLRNANSDNFSNFEEMAFSLIQINLPKVFLERYQELTRLAKDLYPKRAKLFLTANAFASNEVYKYWTGLVREKGSAEHIIIQHGANYGHSMIRSEEDYEIHTSSKYLTSGWEMKGNKDVVPFIGSAFLGRIGDYRATKTNFNPKGKTLWVLCSVPKYFYTQWSAPQGPMFIKYLDSQVKFLKSLKNNSRKNILCRDYHYDYGWGDVDYIQTKTEPFLIDTARKPLRRMIQDARLTVFTYDCTSMQESMSLNLPTICYWEEKFFPWRNSAKDLLEKLKEANIFHHNPVDAADFIESLSDQKELEDWWNSDKVQSARELYCLSYANTSSEEFNRWKELISKQ